MKGIKKPQIEGICNITNGKNQDAQNEDIQILF